MYSNLKFSSDNVTAKLTGYMIRWNIVSATGVGGVVVLSKLDGTREFNNFRIVLK